MEIKELKNLITDLTIAEQIIETSIMGGLTRNTFKTFLESAKTNPEDFEILRDRLAGWLYKQQTNHIYGISRNN